MTLKRYYTTTEQKKNASCATAPIKRYVIVFTSHLMFVNNKWDMKTYIKQDMNTITHLLISAAAHAHSVSVFQYKKGRGVSPSACGAMSQVAWIIREVISALSNLLPGYLSSSDMAELADPGDFAVGDLWPSKK